MTDTNRIRANLQGAPGIDPTLLQGSTARPAAPTSSTGPSFAELLRTRQGLAEDAGAATEVRFSAHAQTRMLSRNINLNDGEMSRITSAVQKAAGKGSKDALVLMDNLAMGW
jgi:flagellar operon protein